MKITQELIESGQSGNGGWTREQLELIGVQWPPKHGWRQRVQGMEIPEADAQKFVAMRGMTLKRQKRLHREHGRFSDLVLNFDAEA